MKGKYARSPSPDPVINKLPELNCTVFPGIPTDPMSTPGEIVGVDEGLLDGLLDGLVVSGLVEGEVDGADGSNL